GGDRPAGIVTDFRGTRMDAPRVPHWRTLRLSTKLVVILFFVLLTGGALELLARTYWRLREKVPFARTDLIWKTFYPEWDISGVDRVRPFHADDTFAVLLRRG